MDLHFGTLAAGTYRSVGFDVPVTFTVQGDLEGWSGGFDNPAILELHAQRNAADSLIFGLPSGFRHPDVGLLESLRMDNASLSDELPVTIDGLAGTWVEFVAPKMDARPHYAQNDDFIIFFGREVGFTEEGGSYFAKIGDHVRLTQIYRGDGILVILVVAKSAAEYSILLEMSDKLLATIQIE